MSEVGGRIGAFREVHASAEARVPPSLGADITDLPVMVFHFAVGKTIAPRL